MTPCATFSNDAGPETRALGLEPGVRECRSCEGRNLVVLRCVARSCVRRPLWSARETRGSNRSSETRRKRKVGADGKRRRPSDAEGGEYRSSFPYEEFIRSSHTTECVRVYVARARAHEDTLSCSDARKCRSSLPSLDLTSCPWHTRRCTLRSAVSFVSVSGNVVSARNGISSGAAKPVRDLMGSRCLRLFRWRVELRYSAVRVPIAPRSSDSCPSTAR